MTNENTKYQQVLKAGADLLGENIKLRERIKTLENYCEELKPSTPVETTGFFSVELCTFGQTKEQNETLLESVGKKIENLLSKNIILSW